MAPERRRKLRRAEGLEGVGDIRSAAAELHSQGTHSGLRGRMRSCWRTESRRQESRVEGAAGGQRQIFKEMQCWLLENNS